MTFLAKFQLSDMGFRRTGYKGRLAIFPPETSLLCSTTPNYDSRGASVKRDFTTRYFTYVSKGWVTISKIPDSSNAKPRRTWLTPRPAPRLIGHLERIDSFGGYDTLINWTEKDERHQQKGQTHIMWCNAPKTNVTHGNEGCLMWECNFYTMKGGHCNSLQCNSGIVG